MNSERLLRLYGRVADSADATARLRSFILDLAIRGRLVPQYPEDEPAWHQLQRISSNKPDRKERLRKTQAIASGSRGEATHLPSGWATAPLSDLVTVLNGRAYKQSELLAAGTPVLRVGNLFTSDKWYYSDLSLGSEKYCDAGDLIYAWSASFGPFIWTGPRVIYHYHIWKLPLHSAQDLSKEYLYNVLLQKTRQIKESGRGISMIHMTKEKMEKIEISVPPLAEQHRIVAKVDELMALCDQLEKARTERETKRDKLATATLARLNTPNAESFRSDAHFALENLQALATRPDQIKQLRQTILSLAVNGNFSPSGSWPSATTTLGRVATLQNGYAFKSEWFARSGVRLLRNVNVSHGSLTWEDVAYLPESRSSEYDRFRLQPGDVVLSLDRPFITTGTKVARVTRDDLPALLLQRVGRFICKDVLSPEYLLLWIHSPHFTSQIDPGRSNGVPHISSRQVESAEIFIPSTDEQRRVVRTVNVLLAVCDALQQALTTRDTERSRLLEALISESLSLPLAPEETPCERSVETAIRQQRRAS